MGTPELGMLGSYLGEVPWGLVRDGLVRADSTSVWPRLVTELCGGRRGHQPGWGGHCRTTQ